MSLTVENPQVNLIDARGPRFGAAITTIVLAAALATGQAWLIIAQAVVFAIGAFAQQVGFGFTVVAIAGLTFAPVIATFAVSMALAAAFLNAAFDFCLGCQIYLRIQRLRAK
jgi:hypothetical protein